MINLPSSNNRLPLTIILVIAATLLLTFAGSRLYRAFYESAAKPVSVATRGAIEFKVQGRGTFLPLQVSHIAPTSDGTLATLLVAEGSRVSADQDLFTIQSPTAIELEATALAAQVAAQADSQAVELRVQREIYESEIAVARATNAVQVANIQRDAELRLVTLGVSGKIAAERASKDADLKAVELALATQVHQLTLQSASAQQAAASRTLDLRAQDHRRAIEAVAALSVKSPVDGVVIALSKQAGERASSGETILSIASAAFRLEADIPEGLSAGVGAGQPVTISAGSATYLGSVAAVAAQSTDGAVKVWVDLADPSSPAGKAKANTAAAVTIHTGKSDDAVTIERPPGAIPFESFRLTTQSRGKVLVTFGAVSAERIAVTSGLEVGEVVILEPVEAPR